MSINRVTISGNLTRDAEMRQSATGTSILTLGVAVNDRRRNPQTDEWEDVPNFVDCVLFGARAQSLQQYMTKGTKVAIEGKLRWSQWETQEGQKRSKLEVIVDEVEFMSRREGQGGQRQAPRRRDQGGQVAAPGVYQPSLPTQQAPQATDDIPF